MTLIWHQRSMGSWQDKCCHLNGNLIQIGYMAYKILADFTVVIHLVWIFFLIFGAFLGRYVPWVKWLHIGGLVFSLLIQFFSWYCPLTHLEVWLRARHDHSLAYTGSFIAHYAERLVYLELAWMLVLIGTFGVIIFSAWLYSLAPGESEKKDFLLRLK